MKDVRVLSQLEVSVGLWWVLHEGDGAAEMGIAVSVGSTSKVLVTGASGLIGSHVVEALIDAGYEPRAYCRGQIPFQAGAFEQVSGDVRDRDALRSAMRGCDAVIHSAALYSYSRRDVAEMEQTNVGGTRNVLDAAAEARVSRVVITSSCATCGPVQGRDADEGDEAPSFELSVPYKRTKLAAERLALERAARGEDIVVVNPTTTIGARDHRPTPSGRMVRDVLTGRIQGYIASGGLNIVAAKDVARGHILALERGRSGQRYLLGGENLTMREAFATIARLGGVAPPRIPVPYPLAFGTAKLLDLVSRLAGAEPSLLVLDEVRLARAPMYFASRKAELELGYEPHSAEEALTAAVKWFGQRLRRASRISLAIEYGHS